MSFFAQGRTARLHLYTFLKEQIRDPHKVYHMLGPIELGLWFRGTFEVSGNFGGPHCGFFVEFSSKKVVVFLHP